MTEKIDDDLRKSVEFIIRIKPYSEESVLNKDILTFLTMLQEAEGELAERNAMTQKITE